MSAVCVNGSSWIVFVNFHPPLFNLLRGQVSVESQLAVQRNDMQLNSTLKIKIGQNIYFQLKDEEIKISDRSCG